jgi:hypothetical protein
MFVKNRINFLAGTDKFIIQKLDNTYTHSLKSIFSYFSQKLTLGNMPENLKPGRKLQRITFNPH